MRRDWTEELELIRKVVEKILNQPGYEIKVTNGEGTEGVFDQTEDVLDAINQCDEEYLVVLFNDEEEGWIFLVWDAYSDDPREVICNNTVSVEWAL